MKTAKITNFGIGQSRVLEGLAKTLESVVYPISRIESKLDKLFIMMQGLSRFLYVPRIIRSDMCRR